MDRKFEELDEETQLSLMGQALIKFLADSALEENQRAVDVPYIVNDLVRILYYVLPPSEMVKHKILEAAQTLIDEDRKRTDRINQLFAANNFYVERYREIKMLYESTSQEAKKRADGEALACQTNS